MPNPRKLLFPFSVLYHTITEVRNKLYDRQVLKSTSYEVPVICVGNLNMGGTGKSPMIEYLLNILKEDYKIATLSRGYKRESEGFHLVESDDSARITGDEPLQFKRKFKDALIAVDANRREGISELLKMSPEVVLLDDAFQHRKVKAGFHVLLTAYGDLYVDDLLLPGGNLRESSAGAKRADVIVVTKCPSDLSEKEMLGIIDKLGPKSHQKVFFTSIKYSEKIFSANSDIPLDEVGKEPFTLVTGIANPKPLLNFLKKKGIQLKHFKYPDHHNFSEEEIIKLKKESKILTTEKDYMRLKDYLNQEDLYYLPIEVGFLKEAEQFNNLILNFINKK